MKLKSLAFVFALCFLLAAVAEHIVDLFPQ